MHTLFFQPLRPLSFIQRMLTFLICFCSCVTFAASPLPAAKAFKFIAAPLDPNSFVLKWTIEPGYFLYRDRIQLTVSTPSIATLGALNYPSSTQKMMPGGQTEAIYRSELTLPVSVLGLTAGETLLTLHYQGCSDLGYCYPPVDTQLKLTINSQLALSQLVREPPSPQTAHKQSPPAFTPIVLFSFYGFGLLLAFTPCVLPMIPVLSGIIVGRGSHASTRHAFLLSLSYVLSMSITYSLIGGVIAFMGHNLQVLLQSPWSISLLSLLFMLLALSMFDRYELRLPTAWQARFANKTNTPIKGHYLHAAMMGMLSTLILSPCVTAPMIGALSYTAQTGNVLEGLLSLLSLGLGMGTPLLLIGTSAGKLLPKAGVWMNDIKHLFGFIFIAMAQHLMSRILPPALSLFLWGVFLIFTSLYLRTFDKAMTSLARWKQGLGLLCLLYGTLMIIGASLGHENPLQPLATQKTTTTLATFPHALTVTTLADTRRALTEAKGQPVLLDFYASWCAACKHLQHQLQTDPTLQAAQQSIRVITVDLSANNEDTEALLNAFHVIAPPTLIFFNSKGNELPQLRLAGTLSNAALLASLQHQTFH